MFLKDAVSWKLFKQIFTWMPPNLSGKSELCFLLRQNLCNFFSGRTVKQRYHVWNKPRIFAARV